MIEIFIVLFGLAVGSFLNVVIYRLPKRIPIILSRSRCPICGKTIRFYDNIPVLSFILLRGRCRYCKSRISFRYPVVEMLTAILFFLSYRLTSTTVEFFVSVYLSCVAVVVSFIDFDEKIIPNTITYPGILLGVVSSLFRPSFGILQSIIGCVVGAIVLFIIAVLGERIFKREAMGFGDVKYVAMIGAFLGLAKLFLVIILSSFIGAIVGLIVLAFAKDKEKARIIPYGPYLSLAMLIAFWFGDKMIDLYTKLFV